MTTIHPLLRSAGLACVGLAFAGGLWAADANSPQSYAQRLPLATVPGAALQRVVLPAQVLAALQTADYRDIRIFNAQGQPVPMALAAGGSATVLAATEKQITLPAYPILGGAGASAGTLAQEGLSLRIEEQQGRRVVQINTSAGTPAAPSGQQLLGALFDTRTLGAPAVSLALDVDLPPAQPVSFQVATSRDLTHWSPLASTVLYRAPAQNGAAGAAQLGSSTIHLTGADLKDQYLRVTWAPAQGGVDLAANVALRGATVTTSRSAAAAARPTVQVNLPTQNKPHELGFSLPFATPVAAIGITPQGSNVLVPVRVLGRNGNQQPWTSLAEGVVYSLQTAGVDQRSAAITLPSYQGNSWRDIRVEADTKTPGFTAPPAVSVEFDPVQLVFVASGDAPFTLAAGLPATDAQAAASAYLPLQSLVPGYQPAQENTLPLARTEVAAAGAANVPASVQAPDLSNKTSTKTMVLWGVLLAGVLALGLMAWALARQTRKVGAPDA
ncbi:MAG: DUF3999 domain-containing protein [Burkholderiaceae bacterium]|nr:DUF3999 domain-containing protein [Burkholderiaceae bacterium]